MPDYCKECEFFEKSCDICGKAMRLHRSKQANPPRSHRECLARFKPKQVSCRQCGKSFEVKTGTQIKCWKNSWQLPDWCEQCKKDSLLVKGALQSLKDHFKFAISLTIEQEGLIFTDKVGIVRSKKTGQVVAKIRMNEKGWFFTERQAEAIDSHTGQKINYTKEGRKGLIFTKRTADSYDARTDKRTHRTENVEKGILFRRRGTETTRE